MNEEYNQKTIKEAVLSEIKSGKAKMRPRWYFLLQAVLCLMGVLIIGIVLVYLTSFVVFMLHHNGVWFAPDFGYEGIGVFLISLPWFLIGVAVAFMVVLEVLVRRYAFAYKKPLLYSLVVIVALAAVAGFTVAKTKVHEGMWRYVEKRKIPFAQSLYEGYGLEKNQSVHMGVITEMTKDGFLLSNIHGEVLNIFITPYTRFPRGVNFETEDRVVIFGNREANNIEAIGIRGVNDKKRIMQGRDGWHHPFLPLESEVPRPR